MHLSHLSLHDFRSYAALELPLESGPTAFLGGNGQGKTNLVEAVDYLSRLASHRVATDAPLVRTGADRAVVRASVVRDGRTALLEVEVHPGRSNRARVNRSPLPRARDLVGLVRTVLFSPEDLAMVKGDPAERRRYLDDLAVLRSPRLAGARAHYDRVLRQRNTLLRTAGGRHGARRDETVLATLDVWDGQLARAGGELLAARLALVEALAPYLGKAYETVARGATREDAELGYRPSLRLEGVPAETALLEQALLAELGRRRGDELDRGVSLVGPHRDELALTLAGGGNRFPVKGYASHGESWSFALALRLAAYDLLRAEGDDPILILDDVFAELDADRRAQLADLVRETEQVLVTAAVADDVPVALAGRRYVVRDGEVRGAD